MKSYRLIDLYADLAAGRGERNYRMKLQNDTVRFEERSEVQKILNALDDYFEQNPEEKNDEALREFYNKLNVLDMCW